MPILEPINATTYRLATGRDNIELGDISAPQCLGHLKYLRNRGTHFALSHAGTPTGLVQVDVPNGIIRIPYGDETVELTVHDPDNEFPDGRAEFNVILESQPAPDGNGEYWQVLDFEANGLTLERILGLDEEYDQARCVEEWGEDYTGTFTITPTEIRAKDGTLLKSKAEHSVHSILGTAIANNHDKSIMGKNPKNGQDISYVRVSRDHLHLPKRLLVDDKGRTARIEDVQIDGNQIKFKLPKAFIEAGNTKYPVRHATGTDPAYTQDMDFWVTDTYGDSDNTWSDYDIFTEKSVPKGTVAEIIIENVEAGVEMNMGIRTDGSSLNRYVEMHEAEGGGYTHVRMFVLVDASTGLVETFCEDVTDDMIFYVVGYWENVGFTEMLNSMWFNDDGWIDIDQCLGFSSTLIANTVYHIVAATAGESAILIGARAGGSSLSRQLLIHEAEGGGETCLDFLAKTDVNADIEVYGVSPAQPKYYILGYFGSELDFVEKFVQVDSLGGGWQLKDWSSELDEDGRMCDFLLVHEHNDAELNIGVRDGDDTTTVRYLSEHESESEGQVGGEWTGFGMSAKSNSTGNVYHYGVVASGGYDVLNFLTGYFKPVGGAVTHWGAAILAGVGTLAGIGELTAIGKATLAGIGTLAAIGRKVLKGAAILAGVGTLAGIGQRIVNGIATLSGTGSVVAQAIAIFAGKATLTGVGLVSAIGNVFGIKYGIATLSGTGALAAIGTVGGIIYGIVTLIGTGALAAQGIGVFIGKATLSGVGTVTAIGRRLVAGVATLSGAGSVTAIGRMLLQGAATLTGTGTVTAIGRKVLYGLATLAGVGTVVAAGLKDLFGKTTLSGAGFLQALATGRNYITVLLQLWGRGLSARLQGRDLTSRLHERTLEVKTKLRRQNE